MPNKITLKIKERIRHYADLMGDIVLDSKRRDLFIFVAVSLVLGTVSLVMTVVNIITRFHILMIHTLAFAVVCYINVGLSLIGNKGYRFARSIFKFEIVFMFASMTIFGEPEGFSAFWTPLLPACGLMFFGLKEGLIIDSVMLLITVFLCWIPAGRSLLMYDYTDSFLLRFPLLYMGFMSAGVVLGLILTYTQNAYHDLSHHDVLTGALNRGGFVESLGTVSERSDTIGFMILDLDFFKRVNDTYGHFIGDEVLCYAVSKIQQCCPGCPVCRWGGEEFAVFVNRGEDTKNFAEKIIRTLDQSECITKEGKVIHQTISCGAVEISRADFDQNTIAVEADNCLYEAKRAGRNRVVYKKI